MKTNFASHFCVINRRNKKQLILRRVAEKVFHPHPNITNKYYCAYNSQLKKDCICGILYE